MTGLAILLPFVLTVVIVVFFMNLLTKPFIGFVKEYFGSSEIFSRFSPKTVTLIIRLLILFSLFFFTVLIGFLGQIFLVNYFLKLGDRIVHKIPFVNKIYKAVQDVVLTIFKDDRKSFTNVVLVPFPTPNSLSLGLISREGLPELTGAKQELVSVFVPGTPNPSIGFMLLFKKEDLVVTDMKVDDALKFIVSCGVILKGKENPHELLPL